MARPLFVFWCSGEAIFETRLISFRRLPACIFHDSGAVHLYGAAIFIASAISRFYHKSFCPPGWPAHALSASAAAGQHSIISRRATAADETVSARSSAACSGFTDAPVLQKIDGAVSSAPRPSVHPPCPVREKQPAGTSHWRNASHELPIQYRHSHIQ